MKEGRERKKLECCRFEPPTAAARHMSPHSPSPEQNNILFTTVLCTLDSGLSVFTSSQSSLSLSFRCSALPISLLLSSPLRLSDTLPSDSVIYPARGHYACCVGLDTLQAFSFLFLSRALPIKRGSRYSSCSIQPHSSLSLLELDLLRD